MRAGFIDPADQPNTQKAKLLTDKVRRELLHGVAIKHRNNSTAVLRAGTVPLRAKPGKRRSLNSAIRHNRRMYSPANADATRTHLNSALAGPVMAKAVHPAALAMLTDSGITARKNACVLELLFTIPPNFAMEERAFFAWCLTFAIAHFGAQNIITADVHRDEAQPHMHVLIMPILGGKLRGTYLLGSLLNRAIDGRRFKGYEIQLEFARALKALLSESLQSHGGIGSLLPMKSAYRTKKTDRSLTIFRQQERPAIITTPILCIGPRSARYCELSKLRQRALRRAGHRKRSRPRPTLSGTHRRTKP